MSAGFLDVCAYLVRRDIYALLSASLHVHVCGFLCVMRKAIIFHNTNQFHPIKRRRVRCSVPFQSALNTHYLSLHTHAVRHKHILQGQNVKESKSCFTVPSVCFIYNYLSFSCSYLVLAAIRSHTLSLCLSLVSASVAVLLFCFI